MYILQDTTMVMNAFMMILEEEEEEEDIMTTRRTPMATVADMGLPRNPRT